MFSGDRISVHTAQQKVKEGATRKMTSGKVSLLGDLIDKGKGLPLQAWTGPEGSRRLRLPDF